MFPCVPSVMTTYKPDNLNRLGVWMEYKESLKIIFNVNQDLYQSADKELLLKLSTLNKAKKLYKFQLAKIFILSNNL